MSDLERRQEAWWKDFFNDLHTLLLFWFWLLDWFLGFKHLGMWKAAVLISDEEFVCLCFQRPGKDLTKKTIRFCCTNPDSREQCSQITKIVSFECSLQNKRCSLRSHFFACADSKSMQSKMQRIVLSCKILECHVQVVLL